MKGESEPVGVPADPSGPGASAVTGEDRRLAYRAFAGRVALSVFTTGFVHLRNLVLLPVLTQQLTVSAFGAWSQVLAVIELLTSVSLLSLNAAVMRFLAGTPGIAALRRGMGTALTLVGITSAVLATVTFAASEWLAETFLQDASRGQLFRVAAVLVPVTSVEKLTFSFYHARLHMKRYSAFVVAESLGYVVVAIALVSAGFGVGDVLLGVLVMRLVLLVASTALLGRDLGLVTGDLPTAVAYLSFSLPLVLVGVFAWFSGLSDRYVVGFFLGAEAVGVYSVSYTLGMVCMVLFAPLFIVLNPTLVRLWEAGDRDGLFLHLNYTLRYGLGLSIPALGGLTVLAQPVVSVVSGPQYFADRSTVGLIGLGLLFLMVSGLVEPLVGLLRRTPVASAIYGATAVLNLVGNLLLVPLWGVRGAAAATCGAYFFQLIAFDRFARRHGLGLPVDWLFLAKCIAAATATMAALSQVHPQGWTAILLVAAASAVLYLILMLLLSAFTRQELVFWRRLVTETRH